MGSDNKNISIDTKGDGIELATYKYPIWLKPKPTEDLICLGFCRFEGGYVLPLSIIKDSSMLISFGLGYEYSFDYAYYERTKKKVIYYDGTVSKIGIAVHNSLRFLSSIFQPHKPRKFMRRLERIKQYFHLFIGNDHVQFIQKNISNGSVLGTVSYNECVSEMSSLTLLKVDIESDEYLILDDIVASKNQLIGLLIEFHNSDLNLDIIKDFLNKMEGFTVVHIRSNIRKGEKGKCPSFTEVTLANNAYCSFIDKEYSYPVKGLDYSFNYKLLFE